MYKTYGNIRISLLCTAIQGIYALEQIGHGQFRTLFIFNDIVSAKIYDKRGDFDYEIVNFLFRMVMFLALHPMEFIFLNSSNFLDHLAMLLTSTLAINC